ncbi:hypothetical protein CAPTEDRAFT_168452 [Capitella teleta]|uniref:Torsin n=1 Tax=Capitella teleta TaxID=283909 RepID=R7UBP8_CAPTE|nr:hypothetical protein CAPTEDRAFT_168452 [Capitella teleta]|eukprot:ELU03404.1 hypothetical protein CAPTEDRAFT_168452 [Capitella teleta]
MLLRVKSRSFVLCLFAVCIFSEFPNDVDGFEPISITTGVASITAIGISTLAANFGSIKSKFLESCDDNWLKKDTQGLKNDLSTRLHGQHLVIENVVKAIQAHKRHLPSKALVMSFHGWTGCGKNYVGRFIAEHLYHQGMKSKFVHLFVATHHFPHASRIETYKDQVRDWIKGNITACPQSMFIFDEVDKMPPGLLDIILPFIDHHEEINGVDYRHSIFLFLSNTGGNLINRKTHEYWSQGRKREEISYKVMEEVVTTGAFNEKTSGLWHSALIEKNLINLFVPFLPMETSHVKLCIRDDLTSKGHEISDEIINKVLDELHFIPEDSKLYSKSGCKRVSEKVNMVMETI